MKHWIKYFLPILSVFFLHFEAARADFTVRLVDAQGDPVENAVITLPDSNIGSVTDAAIMDQIDRQFVPHVLVVQTGQTVMFPNSDQVRHHVYSFSKPNDFEIKLYSGINDAPVTFEYPGVVVLGCNIHDNMLGYIYVSDKTQSRATDPNGMAVFQGDPPENVRVWHSGLSASGTTEISVPLTETATTDLWQLQVNINSRPTPAKTTNTFRSRFN